MTIKLISLPFHWVYPSAPAKYVGCRVSIPVFDPNAPERDEALVRTARVVSFNAAVGSVGGKRYRGTKLPRTVLVPTAKLALRREDRGNGMKLAAPRLMNLGFRRFKVEDLMTTPFAKCPSEDVPKRTLKKLERICG